MKEIKKTQLSRWNRAYEADPQRRLAELALSKSNMSDAARRRCGSAS